MAQGLTAQPLSDGWKGLVLWAQEWACLWATLIQTPTYHSFFFWSTDISFMGLTLTSPYPKDDPLIISPSHCFGLKIHFTHVINREPIEIASETATAAH